MCAFTDTLARTTGEWRGLAVDSSGNVYVSDNGAIRVITAGGVVTTLAGYQEKHSSLSPRHRDRHANNADSLQRNRGRLTP
jgi:hypothetical protein